MFCFTTIKRSFHQKVTVKMNSKRTPLICKSRCLVFSTQYQLFLKIRPPPREDFPLYSLLPRTYAISSTRIRTIAKLVKVNERWQQTSALESGLVKLAVEVALSLACR